MPVHWATEKSRWRFRYRRRAGGKRYQVTKLLPKGWSQRQAEAYDRKQCGRLFAETSGIATPRLPLAGAVELYLDHRCPELANGKKVARDLEHLAGKIETAYLDEVSDVAADYVKENPHLSDGTLHNRLAYLRAAVNYARKEHKYGKGLPDYTADMSIPTPDNERQVYAKLPELNKLWKALKDDEARALFTMDFYMGLRWRAELLTRKPEHITRNGRDVWLEIGRTKNGEPVMKFVHPAARPYLKFLPFTHADKWFYQRWHAATEEIGRPDLKPHDLRHSLGSEVISRPGGNLDDVRSALHHKSLQSAKRYGHRYPSRQKAIFMGIRGAIVGHPKKRARKK